MPQQKTNALQENASSFMQHLDNAAYTNPYAPKNKRANKQKANKRNTSHLKPPTVTTPDRSDAAAVMGRRNSL